jgi:hypothetical protein
LLNKLDRFFKDKDGQVVVWQNPNLPLLGWIIFKILSLIIISRNLKSGCEQLSTTFLFTWAFLEATKGVNNFRKLLGGVVIVLVVLSYLK